MKQVPVRVKNILPGSSAAKAGVRRRDLILAIDNEPICDTLDFSFFTSQESFALEVERQTTQLTLTVMREPGQPLGIELYPPKTLRCGNKCVFCFIDQMPKGGRKSLYIKDEDYLESFYNGNYMTLSTISNSEIDRIASRGLSPLFVSVHATDVRIRNQMLGNPRAPSIMEQLTKLTRQDVFLHTQIVVCPGMNDGRVLDTTLKDLVSLGDALISCSVVPVGLTRFRKVPLQPVTPEIARTIISQVVTISNRDAETVGFRRIFCADEFFCAAGIDLPPPAWYEDYPQIENGVGLISQLNEEWRLLKRKLMKPSPTKHLQAGIFTGELAAPVLRPIAASLSRITGIPLDVITVSNHYFGTTVTVAGLLTAHDVCNAARASSVDTVIIPAAMFNSHGHTLDGWSIGRMSRVCNKPVVAPPNLQELAEHLGCRKGSPS